MDDEPTTTQDSGGVEAPVPNEHWEFAGWGTAHKLDDLGEGPIEVHHLGKGHGHKLSQLQATAICGNDITSSCLYVSALCALYAGPLAPIALAIVAGVLYLFRGIYAEVGSALPLNGGAYNVLLNTTSKAWASLAACFTLLSYMATAVISANEAMHYADNIAKLVVGAGAAAQHAAAGHNNVLDIFFATIVLLGLFAVLNVIGITESAVVALAIFAIHIVTLVVLSLATGIVMASDLSIFQANWALPAPGGMTKALFFGFSAALLGISGFESSANFIEEQKPGVFPKTLRNMWIAVAVFNPMISVLSMGLIPLGELHEHKTDLLAHMGSLTGSVFGQMTGTILKTWVSVDAVLVLSGAVLTSYVGVTGLVRRMSLDRCLPQVLLQENRWRNTNHWIIIAFFALCCAILWITRTTTNPGGDVDMLGGVYTISFLGVMGLFALGNGLLKVSRGRLPRAERATWFAVIIALCAVAVGLAGNIMREPAKAVLDSLPKGGTPPPSGFDNARVFMLFFLGTAVAVAIMFLRIQIMKVVLFISNELVEKVRGLNSWLHERVRGKIDEINSQVVIFFTRGDNAANLNRAALYVKANEQTKVMRVVHVYQDEEDIPKGLSEDLKNIDRLYPKLRIDFVAVKGQFGPELIERLSRHMNVPKNYMFIGCPGDRFPHNIAELGGVRLIL